MTRNEVVLDYSTLAYFCVSRSPCCIILTVRLSNANAVYGLLKSAAGIETGFEPGLVIG